MRHLRSHSDPLYTKFSSSHADTPKLGLIDELKFVCKVLGGILAVLWGLEIIDALVFHGLLDLLGIHPRTIFGLVGVVASPFLHGGFGHLLSNTAGLLIFGTLVLLWGRKEFALVTLSSMLIGGLGVWLIGASGSLHIGASGVVFGYFGYVLMRGWYERKPLSVIVSIAIAVMFGGVLAGAVPWLAGPGISWEGHLFGLLGGVLVARRFKSTRSHSLAS